MSGNYQDPRWQRLRLEVMQRDNFACVACRDSESPLHVHHKEYHGELWDTPIGRLQTLCDLCHKVLGRHPKGGIYWVRSGDEEPFLVVSHCPLCHYDSFEVERSNLYEGPDGSRYERLYCGSKTCDWWYPLFFTVLFRTWGLHDGKPKDG